MALSDLIWGSVAFLLTVMTLSYLLGDNPLFRLAVYVFVGVAAGYAAVVALYNVIWPTVLLPVLQPVTPAQRLLAVIPLVMGVLLLFKLSPALTRLGNPVVGYLVGVGAAIAIGGAVVGTLFPQAAATAGLFDLQAAQAQGVSAAERLFDAVFMLVGVVSTLLYFHFGGRRQDRQRPAWVKPLAALGEGFIAVAFGAIFAGVYLAALTALVDRVHFLVRFVQNLLGG